MLDFSVVIPAKNAEKTIGKCIDCVLNQNHPKDKYEVIVVDNDSSDGTEQIIRQFPVKYLLSKKPGSGAARNLGVKNSKGKIIAFVDSGGFADRNWLLEAYGFFEKNKEANIAGGKMQPYENSLVKRTIFITKRNQPFYIEHGFASTANMFIKKSKFEQLRGFDERLLLGSVDCEFGERASALGERIFLLEKAIVKYGSRSFLKFLKREFRRGRSHAHLNLLRKEGLNYTFIRSHKTIGSVKQFLSDKKHTALEAVFFLGMGGAGKICWLFGLLFENLHLLVDRKRRQQILGASD